METISVRRVKRSISDAAYFSNIYYMDDWGTIKKFLSLEGSSDRTNKKRGSRVF